MNSNKRKRAEHLDSSDKPTAIAPRPHERPGSRAERMEHGQPVALVHYFILEERENLAEAPVGPLIKDGSFMKKSD